jgi:hypothetical protein
MFSFLRRLFSGGNYTHHRHGHVRSVQQPTGKALVRRFQGKFTCGCPWPRDELAPEFCPNHPGATRVYKNETVLEMKNVEILEVADGTGS